MATAARELSLVTALRAAPAQFLLQEEQVDHGGANGGYGLAWGGSYRRRGRWPGELGFGKLGQRRKKPRLRLVVEFLYGARGASSRRRARRSCQHRGEAEHGSVLSSMREREDEDEFLSQIFDEGVWWAGLGPVLGCGAGLLVDCGAGLRRLVRSR
jgi:hypothetical protein